MRSFLSSDEAATSIEYGLIAAGIALAILVVVFALGDTVFDLLYSQLPNAFSQD
jgi:Flp pilus assembly pilin Flp